MSTWGTRRLLTLADSREAFVPLGAGVRVGVDFAELFDPVKAGISNLPVTPSTAVI